MMSNVFRQSIDRNSSATMIVGRSSGSVMRQNIWAGVAPSICADSYGSRGSVASPARVISVMSGVHSQVSTTASAGITMRASLTHL